MMINSLINYKPFHQHQISWWCYQVILKTRYVHLPCWFIIVFRSLDYKVRLHGTLSVLQSELTSFPLLAFLLWKVSFFLSVWYLSEMKSSHLWILRQLISTCPFLGRIPGDLRWLSHLGIVWFQTLKFISASMITSSLDVYVCMYVCMYAHIYINTYVCVYMGICVYMYILWSCSLNQKAASLCVSTSLEESVFSGRRERRKRG